MNRNVQQDIDWTALLSPRFNTEQGRLMLPPTGFWKVWGLVNISIWLSSPPIGLITGKNSFRKKNVIGYISFCVHQDSGWDCVIQIKGWRRLIKKYQGECGRRLEEIEKVKIRTVWLLQPTTLPHTDTLTLSWYISDKAHK